MLPRIRGQKQDHLSYSCWHQTNIGEESWHRCAARISIHCGNGQLGRTNYGRDKESTDQCLERKADHPACGERSIENVSSFILVMRHIIYCWRTLRPRPRLVAARAAPAKASKESGFMGNGFRIGRGKIRTMRFKKAHVADSGNKSVK